MAGGPRRRRALGVAGIVEKFPHLTWVSVTSVRHDRATSQTGTFVEPRSAGHRAGWLRRWAFRMARRWCQAGEIGVLMHGASLYGVIGAMLSLRSRGQAVAAECEPALGQTIDLSLQEVGLWLSPETGVPHLLGRPGASAPGRQSPAGHEPDGHVPGIGRLRGDHRHPAGPLERNGAVGSARSPATTAFSTRSSWTSWCGARRWKPWTHGWKS